MGKTYKESYYGSKQAKLAAEYQSKKKIKHHKMDAYNRTNFKKMCRLLKDRVVKDTKKNRMKNDCPSQCDKTHCDVCQFADNKTVVIQEPSPELYGREIYY